MNVRRLGGREDTAGIIRVQGLAWREAYADLLPTEIIQQQTVDPSEEEIRQWHDWLRENRDGILVAVDDEEAVRGFADFRWGDAETKEFVGDEEAGLKAIYVHPDYWGSGIGTALLERGMESLPDDVDAVRLEMLSGNEVGHQFYQARGFERTDTTTHEIGGTQYPTDIYTIKI
ncbi:GNAT family N-acetyltransferase [Halorubrum vacuolatum]|uniref:Acetyltransferase (GNAT) family protein n=1 Tax=Halorubrum vacuolatum TaxID=63740 RepID=A0A238Y2S6_HALVU|nr:GNAT family N-acetyltransferase [Halorubrum vacuolatum]SNR64963.1 Acetyltransferase (GNAT) family protein [Halorubrum vacuolatum]